jgi:hypothetical protein
MKKFLILSFLVLSSYAQAVTVGVVQEKSVVGGTNKTLAIANATGKLVERCSKFGATVDVYDINISETNSRMVGQSVTAIVKALCVKI